MSDGSFESPQRLYFSFAPMALPLALAVVGGYVLAQSVGWWVVLPIAALAASSWGFVWRRIDIDDSALTFVPAVPLKRGRTITASAVNSVALNDARLYRRGVFSNTTIRIDAQGFHPWNIRAFYGASYFAKPFSVEQQLAMLNSIRTAA